MNKRHQSIFSQNSQPVIFRNTESIVIPPYAAMIVTKWFTGTESRKYKAEVRRCTEEDEKAQNHMMVLFNRGTPVPAEGMGTGTHTTPSVVRVGRYGDDDTIPEPFMSVGPARDSWDLWKGGGTHTVQYHINQQAIDDAAAADLESTLDGDPLTDTTTIVPPLALVGHHTSPGLWVKTQAVTGVSETDGYVIGTATLQNRDEDSEKFVDAESGDPKIPMEVEFVHGGGDIDADQIGQVKMVSGKWAIDVQYC